MVFTKSKSIVCIIMDGVQKYNGPVLQKHCFGMWSVIGKGYDIC